MSAASRKSNGVARGAVLRRHEPVAFEPRKAALDLGDAGLAGRGELARRARILRVERTQQVDGKGAHGGSI